MILLFSAPSETHYKWPTEEESTRRSVISETSLEINPESHLDLDAVTFLTDKTD